MSAVVDSPSAWIDVLRETQAVGRGVRARWQRAWSGCSSDRRQGGLTRCQHGLTFPPTRTLGPNTPPAAVACRAIPRGDRSSTLVIDGGVVTPSSSSRCSSSRYRRLRCSRGHRCEIEVSTTVSGVGSPRPRRFIQAVARPTDDDRADLPAGHVVDSVDMSRHRRVRELHRRVVASRRGRNGRLTSASSRRSGRSRPCRRRRRWGASHS